MLRIDEMLRLHTDETGIVWCGQSGVQAYCSKLTPAEFVLRQVFEDARHIRVLGVPSNAKLICLIHDAWKRKAKSKARRLQIGSPQCCFQKLLLRSPPFVLQQIWQPTPSALPHWHDLTDNDYTMYAAVDTWRDAAGEVNDKLRVLMPYHPAYHSLNFVASGDRDAAFKLVCQIVDPRWYINPHRPNRTNRLWEYLGLNPQTVRKLHEDRKPSCVQAELAANVIQAWSGGKSDTEVDFACPTNFPWRIYKQHGSDWRGVLRASRKFVEFVRWVWLQNLTQSHDQIFNPRTFFKHNQHEAFAYTTHVSVQ